MTQRNATLQAEAVLCLWEAMLDARLESTLPAMVDAWEATGTHTMRHHAITLAPFVLDVYDALPPSVRLAPLAYDYDVVPAILATLQWDGAEVQRPSVADAAAAVAAALDHIVNTEPTPLKTPGPLAFMRAGDVFESTGDDGREPGFYVVVDNVSGDADGPMTRAEARKHGDAFAA